MLVRIPLRTWLFVSCVVKVAAFVTSWSRVPVVYPLTKSWDWPHSWPGCCREKKPFLTLPKTEPCSPGLPAPQLTWFRTQWQHFRAYGFCCHPLRTTGQRISAFLRLKICAKYQYKQGYQKSLLSPLCKSHCKAIVCPSTHSPLTANIRMVIRHKFRHKHHQSSQRRHTEIRFST
jgi:hypothetical protein